MTRSLGSEMLLQPNAQHEASGALFRREVYR